MFDFDFGFCVFYGYFGCVCVVLLDSFGGVLTITLRFLLLFGFGLICGFFWVCGIGFGECL